MLVAELEKSLANIKRIYISADEFWRVNYQSCDCLKIIIETDDSMILLKHQDFRKNGCINFDKVSDIDKQNYKYKVNLENELFALEKVVCFDEGFVKVIKFAGDDVFLFIFASKDNLILTKSKYDILDETNDFFEEEAILDIIEIE